MQLSCNRDLVAIIQMPPLNRGESVVWVNGVTKMMHPGWLFLVLGLVACGDDGAEAPAASGGAGGGSAGGASGEAGAVGEAGSAGEQAGGVAGSAEAGSGGSSGATAGAGQGSAVACGQCFPLEELPESLRKKAEKVLLDALDAEALFSIVGGVKPMSSGFLSLNFPADKPEPAAAAEARQILAALRCGEGISAGLQVFNAVFDGQKSADGVFFRRPSFDGVVSERPVFGEIGVKDWTKPVDVVDAVDKDPTTRRFRAYGYLFGYPDHAVDFFVQAEEQKASTGKFVERDFFAMPTFSGLTGGYTYAVPKGYTPVAVDLDLRNKAADILASYQKHRAQFIGEGKPGPVALLRSWFDDGTGQCSPDHAKIEAGAGEYKLPASCWKGLKSCNPLTNEGCDGAAGWACDLSTEGPQCFEPPNSQKLGESCNNSNGPFCEGGGHCDKSVCAAFCCSSEDCAEGDECEAIGSEGSLGVCRKPGACKPAGGSCSKPAGCCSGDCHVGHCH